MARKPRLVLNGNRRAVVKKLQTALKMIAGMDSREQDRAGTLLATPILFVDRTPVQVAFQRLDDQCANLLALKQ